MVPDGAGLRPDRAAACSKLGRRNIEAALATFPRNAHAAHIRAHLYYEAGEREAGLAYLKDWAKDYPRDGQIHCHVNWHIAIWAMETGRREEAWAVYRDAMRPGAAWGPQLNVLTDCAAFLARAEINGGPREPVLWRDLAEYGAKWFPNSGVAFADTHSALAFAMAGDGEALARIAETPKGPAADMLAPIARGFGAFANGDWTAAIASVEPQLPPTSGSGEAALSAISSSIPSPAPSSGQASPMPRATSSLTRRPQNRAAPAFPWQGFEAGAFPCHDTSGGLPGEYTCV